MACELTDFSSQADDRLSEKETEDLMAWMRNALGSRVTNVKVRPSGDRPPPGPHGSTDYTAGFELLAWWEFTQYLGVTRLVAAASECTLTYV